MEALRVLLVITTLLTFSINTVLADELRPDKDKKCQNDVMETGFRLLNANNYKKRMTFYYIPENKVKTKINIKQKRIYIYKGVFPFIEDANELAAVMSLDMARLMDQQAGFFRKFSISFSPRKYEVKADKKAVDLMVKAGYNPVALINLINKTAKEPSWFEYNIFHHKGSERTAYIYHYIYEKYPVFIAQNEYLKSAYYQNFLRTSKKDRKKSKLIQQERIKLQESDHEQTEKI